MASRGAPALISISPSPYTNSPGIMMRDPPPAYRCSSNRMVDGDELRAVRERGLYLHVVQHLRHTLHDVVAAEYLTTADHQLGHGAAVAGTFEQVVGEDGDGLGVVEFQAACSPAAGKLGRVREQQPVLLVRGQTHSGDAATGGACPQRSMRAIPECSAAAPVRAPPCG